MKERSRLTRRGDVKANEGEERSRLMRRGEVETNEERRGQG